MKHVLPGLLTLLALCGAGTAQEPAAVPALIETLTNRAAPVDAAVWINRQAPLHSRVFTANASGGIIAFDLLGYVRQRLPGPPMSALDARQDMVLDGVAETLVVAALAGDNSLAFYLADERGRLREATPRPLPASPAPILSPIAGLALHQGRDGMASLFVSFAGGEVVHWTLGAGEDGIALTLARQFRAGEEAGALVADDALDLLYVASGREIRRFATDAAGEPDGALVDIFGAPCFATANVTGLAIYPTRPEEGWLIAVDATGRLALYRRAAVRGEQACIGTLRIGEGMTEAVGAVGAIEASAFGFGPLFPRGVLILADPSNAGALNLKYVSWQEAIDALRLDQWVSAESGIGRATSPSRSRLAQRMSSTTATKASPEASPIQMPTPRQPSVKPAT